MPASAGVARLRLAKERAASNVRVAKARATSGARVALERATFAARVALDLLLIAVGAATTWLAGIWVVGTLVLDVPAPAGASASEHQPLQVRQALAPPAAGAYAFDGLPRKLDGELACPSIGLLDYPGTRVRLEPAARIAPSFREHVIALEQVTGETALRVYGRAPAALLIAASYHCRPVTGNRERLSEHALGNAIDITAVRFDADPASGQPGFEVRVDRHWNARGDALDRQHARFLRELTDELLRRNVFRTLLGPAHPNHEDHFHFDMAPHHYVAL